MPQIIVLDTCVLISNVLRQGLLDLARQGCFVPAWSRVIGDEWVRNAARLWEIDVPDVQAQWDALQAVWPAADLGEVAEYKQGLSRSDPKDWHVVAAARKALALAGPQARAAVITRNIRDFNRAELFHLGLDLLDPDQLMLRCLHEYPACVLATLSRVPDYAVEYGRPWAPIGAILKRERLFRLNRQYQVILSEQEGPRSDAASAADAAVDQPQNGMPGAADGEVPRQGERGAASRSVRP